MEQTSNIVVPEKIVPWRSIAKTYSESLDYMENRRLGVIKSFRTPLASFNDATLDGLEWHSLTIIGARPGDFKSSFKDQIIKEAFKNNADQTFRILDVSFEMFARTTRIREYTSVLNKSYKELCSAGSTLSKDHITEAHNYAKTKAKLPIDIIDEPCTISEFKEVITQYMSEHALKDAQKNYIRNEWGRIQYVSTLITLDHSILFKRDKGEKDTMDMLYNLGNALTYLKKVYPIAFIILSQLNRGIESSERNQNSKFEAFPTSQDLFGADALNMHADNIALINRPGKKNIHYYGPENYNIEDEYIMAFHYVKTRNGDNRLSFCRADGKTMTIYDIANPERAESTSKFQKKKKE